MREGTWMAPQSRALSFVGTRGSPRDSSLVWHLELLLAAPPAPSRTFLTTADPGFLAGGLLSLQHHPVGFAPWTRRLEVACRALAEPPATLLALGDCRAPPGPTALAAWERAWCRSGKQCPEGPFFSRGQFIELGELQETQARPGTPGRNA